MAVQTYRRYGDEEKVRVLALYRSLGGNAYRAAKTAGIPRTTLHRWLQELGPDYGKVEESGIAERGTDADPEADTVTTESQSSVLAALVKFDRIRHLYLDRLQIPEVVKGTNARDASSIVKDAQAQIQLLTGQPTGRKEITVRYVEPGALRKMARQRHLDRLAHRGGTASLTVPLSVSGAATDPALVSGDATALPVEEPPLYAERDTGAEGDAGSGTRMPGVVSVAKDPSASS